MVEIANSSFRMDTHLKGQLQDLARYILDERERREWYFPRILFNETPWQMLLVLYLSETGRLSSDALFNSVLVSPSTGSRWIEYLANEDLVTRHAEPSEESRSMVELAPKGLNLLQLYLSDRLLRAEQRYKPNEETSHSTKARIGIGIAMLFTAALSAGICFLLTSF